MKYEFKMRLILHLTKNYYNFILPYFIGVSRFFWLKVGIIILLRLVMALQEKIKREIFSLLSYCAIIFVVISWQILAYKSGASFLLRTNYCDVNLSPTGISIH